MCTASVTVAGALNYEGNGKHTIIIRATDKGGLFVAIRFTIAVVDVNDKPTVKRQHEQTEKNDIALFL